MRNIAFRIALVWLILSAAPAHAQAGAEARLDAIEQLLQAGQPRQAQAALSESRASLQSAAAVTLSRARILEARAHGAAGNSAQALELIEDLLKQPEALEPHQRLMAHTLAAELRLDEQDLEGGLEHFQQAMTLAPRIRHPAAQFEAWLLAADVHLRIGEAATALQFIAMTLEDLESRTLPVLECRALTARARAMLMRGSPGRPTDTLQRMVTSCRQADNPALVAAARLVQGKTLLQDGRRDRAREALEQADQAFGQTGDPAGQTAARMELARLWMSEERVELAAGIIDDLLSDDELPEDALLHASILDLAAELAAGDGDLQSAYELRRRELELIRTGHQQRQRMRLMLLLSGQRTQQQQLTLELLNNRNEMLELNQATRQQQLLSIGFGGAGSALAAVLLGFLLIKSGRDRKQLQRMSRHDGLTGLYTHTHFFELGEQMFTRARNRGTPLTLVLADADHFKQINDEHGHLAGDRLLEHLGRAFRDSFEDDAVLGRLGGEEFGVILENCDLDGALARVERLRAAIGATAPGEIRATLSFGIAEMANQRNLEMLFAQADQALYDAKDAGRNRVVTVARLQLPGSSLLT